MDRDTGGLARVIAVIGGGWAGCAAAVELARRGYRVELHESAPALGGRARAVNRDGLPLDNGEHLLLGAYADTLALSAIVHDNASPWTRSPLWIRPFAADQANALSLRARNLPAPFGLLAGVLGAAGLSWRERVATIRWFARQRHAGFRTDDDATVAELLRDLPPRVRDDLWTPLCLAALNTPPPRASAQVFLNVLRESLGAATGATEMLVPNNGLAAAIPERAAQWLVARGHSVRTSSRTRIADIDDGVRVTGSSGMSRADAVIVAVGPHQLAAAFEPALRVRDGRIADAVRDVQQFAWEPITTVYLGYGAGVAVPAGLVRLDDNPGQWLFDRRDILARAPTSSTTADLRALLSVVISAHGPHESLQHPELVAAIDAQLRRSNRRMPPLGWSQVIEEKRATYACVPALARPACGPLSGQVYLAGDYTYAAFPATLEAAVRSGFTAARALMRDVPA